ncbi:MAG TPA: lyase family protein [Microlunatus sp.]|nr:lyase family protein [Microlunatus sp.]
MSDLFWPGDERAGTLLGEAELLQTMEAVEAAWLEALVAGGIAPISARHPVRGLVGADDVDAVARAAEAGGNPVIPLVGLLRDRLPGESARWLHRGLTSQDVLDTALVLLLRDVLDRLDTELRRQVRELLRLTTAHAETAEIGRTLTQHAVPITFGLKTAGWLTGVLDAAVTLERARAGLAAQLGGAAGTAAATVELARLQGRSEPIEVALRLIETTATALGLPARAPWHTTRAPLTAVADALVTCTDAYGHLAADVTTLSRPEIAELAEGAGGGSSTMPHKRNPALSVLIRRAALAGPGLAATVHLAAATTVDERPDGAWHAEWAALRDLGRRTVVAASQTSDLLADLRVDTERMAAHLDRAAGADAEQRSMAALVGAEPSATYLGATPRWIEVAVRRGETYLMADGPVGPEGPDEKETT